MAHAAAASAPNSLEACRTVFASSLRRRAALLVLGRQLRVPTLDAALCVLAPRTSWCVPAPADLRLRPPGPPSPGRSAAGRPPPGHPAAAHSSSVRPPAARHSSPSIAVIHARRVDLHHGTDFSRHAAVAAATVTVGSSSATRLFVREGPDEVAEDAVVLDAFGHLYRRAEERGERLLVHVTHGAIRRELEAVAASFPAIDLVHAATGRIAAVAMTAAAAIGSRVRRIEEEFHQQVADSITPLPELRVATDASKRHRGQAVGIAYVDETGRFRQAAIAHACSVLVGELSAIAMAVSSLRKRDLHVITDSLFAVRALSGSPECASERFGSSVGALVRKVQRAVGARSVRFTWVRGHSGHELNEIADRLAVAARRGCEARLTRSELGAIAMRIVEDLEPPAAGAPGGRQSRPAQANRTLAAA